MERNRFRSASFSATPSAVLRDPGYTNETGNPRAEFWRSKILFAYMSEITSQQIFDLISLESQVQQCTNLKKEKMQRKKIIF